MKWISRITEMASQEMAWLDWSFLIDRKYCCLAVVTIWTSFKNKEDSWLEEIYHKYVIISQCLESNAAFYHFALWRYDYEGVNYG